MPEPDNPEQPEQPQTVACNLLSVSVQVMQEDPHDPALNPHPDPKPKLMLAMLFADQTFPDQRLGIAVDIQDAPRVAQIIIAALEMFKSKQAEAVKKALILPVQRKTGLIDIRGRPLNDRQNPRRRPPHSR